MGVPKSWMARSRVSIAIFTPAQNPRGLAKMIFMRFPDRALTGFENKPQNHHNAPPIR
jgi:hypothetical protein